MSSHATRASGMSESSVQGYIGMMHAKDEGMDNATPRTSANTGPTTFRQRAEEALKPAVRSTATPPAP